MTCPRCGADTPDDARFCPSCGTDLAAAAPREERKFVSILFVDLVGSTAHADGADPATGPASATRQSVRVFTSRPLRDMGCAIIERIV